LHQDRYHHNYPFCWRCDQPLVYYASQSWFVRTTERKRQLTQLNQTIGWHTHPLGGTAVVESITAIPSGAEDQVYLSVQRTLWEASA